MSTPHEPPGVTSDAASHADGVAAPDVLLEDASDDSDTEEVQRAAVNNLLRDAAFEMMEWKAAHLRGVRDVLPALQALLNDKPLSAEERARSMQHLRDWAHGQHVQLYGKTSPQVGPLACAASSAPPPPLTRAPPAQTDDIMCGWLRKSGKHGLAWQRRWVLLSEGQLLYYEDVAVRAAPALRLRAARAPDRATAAHQAQGHPAADWLRVPRAAQASLRI